MPPALFGCVASGPPAFELPPAVPPALCANASELVSANAAANAIVLSFMVLPQLFELQQTNLNRLGSYRTVSAASLPYKEETA
jgi:hypothetical protein